MLEVDIKKALEKHLIERSSSGWSVRVIEELAVSGGVARADLVDVTELHCYEIKSEKDSLKRLVSQGARYMRVFDQITLVTAPCHLEAALTVLPSSWGIILVPKDSEGDFVEFRQAGRNSMQEPNHVSSLLAKDECLSILSKQGLQEGRRSLSLYKLQDFVAETFPLDQLKDLVRSALEVRVDQRSPV